MNQPELLSNLNESEFSTRVHSYLSALAKALEAESKAQGAPRYSIDIAQETLANLAGVSVKTIKRAQVDCQRLKLVTVEGRSNGPKLPNRIYWNGLPSGDNPASGVNASWDSSASGDNSASGDSLPLEANPLVAKSDEAEVSPPSTPANDDSAFPDQTSAANDAFSWDDLSEDNRFRFHERVAIMKDSGIKNPLDEALKTVEFQAFRVVVEGNRGYKVETAPLTLAAMVEQLSGIASRFVGGRVIGAFPLGLPELQRVVEAGIGEEGEAS